MDDDIERVETGIEGLDELLHGGIPSKHSVFLSGPAGSGKTTFGLEFLYRGVTEYDENGLFVSFEEGQEELVRDIPFDWEFEDLIRSGRINIVKYDPYQYEDIISLIRTNVRENNAKRVVIDSLTALSLYINDVKDIRKMILDMSEELRKLETTALYTGEIRSGHTEEVSRFGVEEFIADGVIELMYGAEGKELTNQILIRKMRGTDHDRQIHPFRFEDDGLKVYAKETAISPSARGGAPSQPSASDEFF